jgi:hypothetical protein
MLFGMPNHSQGVFVTEIETTCNDVTEIYVLSFVTQEELLFGHQIVKDPGCCRVFGV